MMIEELFHHPMWRESPGTNGIPILIIFSMFRDEFPWLYELGTQLYRAIENGDQSAIDRTRKTLVNIVEITSHDPFVFDMLGGPDDDESFMMLRHLIHDIDRFIPGPKRLRKREPSPQEKEP